MERRKEIVHFVKKFIFHLRRRRKKKFVWKFSLVLIACIPAHSVGILGQIAMSFHPQ